MLPVDADRTTVVLAQEPAPPHITQTHADCTPTQLDREPATPLLTPTLADTNPVPVDTSPSPPQSTQTRAVSKATAVPKARGQPLRTPSQRLKQKKNCSQVRFRSYGSYYFALASLYLLIPTNLIDTSYSYIMSSFLHSHHILKYVILSCLVSHHTCEIVSCYPV